MSRFNDWLAVKITNAVGSMWTAYLFGLLTIVSLPAAIASHNAIVIVSWIAQTFLQLVLLPIIIVGQNVQSQKHDQVLASVQKIHTHLNIRDTITPEGELQAMEEVKQHLEAALDALVNRVEQSPEIQDIISHVNDVKAHVEAVLGMGAQPPGPEAPAETPSEASSEEVAETPAQESAEPSAEPQAPAEQPQVSQPESPVTDEAGNPVTDPNAPH